MGKGIWEPKLWFWLWRGLTTRPLVLKPGKLLISSNTTLMIPIRYYAKLKTMLCDGWFQSSVVLLNFGSWLLWYATIYSPHFMVFAAIIAVNDEPSIVYRLFFPSLLEIIINSEWKGLGRGYKLWKTCSAIRGQCYLFNVTIFRNGQRAHSVFSFNACHCCDTQVHAYRHSMQKGLSV